MHKSLLATIGVCNSHVVLYLPFQQYDENTIVKKKRSHLWQCSHSSKFMSCIPFLHVTYLQSVYVILSEVAHFYCYKLLLWTIQDNFSGSQRLMEIVLPFLSVHTTVTVLIHEPCTSTNWLLLPLWVPGNLQIDSGEQVYIHVVVVLNGGAWTLAGTL